MTEPREQLTLDMLFRQFSKIMQTQVEVLRARVAELEAELALLRGSLAPQPAEDEPTQYTHNVPPNAPT